MKKIIALFSVFLFAFVLVNYGGDNPKKKQQTAPVIKTDRLTTLLKDRKDLQSELDNFEKENKNFAKMKKAYSDYLVIVNKIVLKDNEITAESKSVMEEIGQIKPAPPSKPAEKVLVPVLNDSIMQVIANISSERDSFHNIALNFEKQVLINEAQADSTVNVVAKMKSELDNMTAENTKLNSRNVALLIFNCIVIVILIITFILFIKKPSAKNSKPATPRTVANPANGKPEEPVVKISSFGIMSTDSIENKLEQIERLANLREKGFLTSEEFEVQKQQIIGR